LKEGYAPFCKHLFILNDFTQAKVNVLKITAENEIHLRSNYEARNEKELPVLQRYFPKALIKDDDLPVAKYLDLILYSREQINKVSNRQNWMFVSLRYPRSSLIMIQPPMIQPPLDGDVQRRRMSPWASRQTQKQHHGAL
jgi:hypothetical protein